MFCQPNQDSASYYILQNFWYTSDVIQKYVENHDNQEEKSI
jgi:hypothetical protein